MFACRGVHRPRVARLEAVPGLDLRSVLHLKIVCEETPLACNVCTKHTLHRACLHDFLLSSPCHDLPLTPTPHTPASCLHTPPCHPYYSLCPLTTHSKVTSRFKIRNSNSSNSRPISLSPPRPTKQTYHSEGLEPSQTVISTSPASRQISGSQKRHHHITTSPHHHITTSPYPHLTTSPPSTQRLKVKKRWISDPISNRYHVATQS